MSVSTKTASSAVSAEGDKNVTEAAKIPFQCQTFADFIALIGRLFYDDACIVLLDFLAKEQRAFLEVDLREKLGWREALIQQKLYLLEKHMLVVQDSTMSRGSRQIIYWRINQNIYGAVQFRYQQLVTRLSCLVEDAAKQHEFECSKLGCNMRYTALDAASCVRSLDNEHPLCSRCGSHLRPSEFETTRNQAKEKCARALQQLTPLRQALLRIANMEIPVFKAYTKGDKKDDEKEAVASASRKPFESITSQGALSESSSSVVSSPPSIKRLLGQVSNQTHNGTTTTTNVPTVAVTSANLQSVTNPASRSIPWFEGATPTVNGSSSSASVSSAASSLKQSSAKISFGLKPKIASAATAAPSNPIGTPYLGLSITPPPPIQLTTPSQAPPAPIVFAEDSNINKTSASTTASPNINNDETQIFVKCLNRKIKLSEVTEDIEQMMTDEEYTAFYNASEPQLL